MLRLRVTNAGPVAWPTATRPDPENQLRLGDRWLDPHSAVVVQDDGRRGLAFPILPGETADLRLEIVAPPQPGTYTLELDMVQEGVAWFGARGGTPLHITVQVIP